MTEATSEACCHAFLHGWVARYGLPRTACSDNGNSFVAKLWRDLQSTLNVKVIFVPLRVRRDSRLGLETVEKSVKNSRLGRGLEKSFLRILSLVSFLGKPFNKSLGLVSVSKHCLSSLVSFLFFNRRASLNEQKKTAAV